MTDKKLVLICFLVCLFTPITFAQDNNVSRVEEDKQFIKKRGFSLDACYRMAEDYIRSQTDQIKAIPYLEYVIESDRYVKPQAFYMLSQAYYYQGKFERAINTITEYIQKEKDGQLIRNAKAELERYKNAAQIASSPLNAMLVNLGATLNSKYAEINPYISNSEDLMVYSSNRTQNFNVYVSKKELLETLWQEPKLAGKYVNTANDEFVAGLSSSGKNLFVHYNQLSGFEDINLSIREKGLYRELEDPGTKINSTYREEGACITENGDTMFFASDRPGGFGGFDLYYSIRLPDGTYGPSINMGEGINTKFDENYPNLASDGSKLYFASKGHNSIGGYDIFYIGRSTTGSWSAPVNIGYPVNNAYDNKSITFSKDGRYAYVSTVDWQTYGDYDLYKVIFLDVEPSYLIVKAEVFIKQGDLNISFNNEKTDPIVTVYRDDEIFGKYTYDKKTNYFVMAFQPGTYIVELEAPGFKTYRKKITINENFYINNLRFLKIFLERAETGQN